MRISVFNLLILILFLLTSPAGAAERLRFDNKIGPSSLLNIQEHARAALKSDISRFSIAKVDLNGDSLNEFILKDSDCVEKSKSCTYRIWAETPDGIIELGSLQARNLLLGDETTYGVRNVMAFDEPLNDFKFTLYAWNPHTSNYEKRDW